MPRTGAWLVLAIGRDPLVFFTELVRREPAAAAAVRDAAGAAAAAMGSASTGRGLAEALDAAAGGVAGVVAEVADHRFIESGGAGGTALVRVSRLDAEAAEAAAAARAAAAESAVAAVERAGLQSLRWERERLRAAVDSNARAIERVRVDLPGAASLAEVRALEAPAEPVADSRPLTAGLGGLLGGLLGVLGALGWIAIDDRVRRGDERPWAARGLTILGTVPAVGGAAGGGATSSSVSGRTEAISEASQQRARGEAAALADAVHAVRAMLEGRDANGRLASGGGSSPGLARVPDADGRTFAITSSGPGSGKTGLCLGLAASLASAGERVLLVDAAWADRPSRGEGNPGGGRQTLDTAVAAMGYLHPEDEDLLRHADPDEPVGLPAFLAGADLSDAAMETRVPGLSLLAAGPGTLDAGRLSGRHVRRLVEAARPLHDVTLIDTSAVSVGLDALFVAGAADGVVLVVSAGERQSAVDRAVTRLRTAERPYWAPCSTGWAARRPRGPPPGRAPPPRRAAGRTPGRACSRRPWAGRRPAPAPAKRTRDDEAAQDAPAAGPGRRVVASTRRHAEPAVPVAAAAEDPTPPAPPAAGGASEGGGGLEHAGDGAGLDELNAADVLSAVTFDELAEPEQRGERDDAGSVAKGGASEDLDVLTERLAEEIASTVEGEGDGEGDGEGKRDREDPAAANAKGESREDADADTDADAEPPAKPRARVVRTRPGPDASLDRLVDRHIDASLPDQGAAPGRDAETGRGSRR